MNLDKLSTGLKMVGWAVYYSDGSKYTSEDGSPDTAPTGGVEVVEVVFDGGYRAASTEDDFYQLPGGSKTLFGEMMDDVAYSSLVESVVDGPVPISLKEKP